MHTVHLGAIDLNLLVALDALLREEHVTRASKRVGLSQSAMSHALSRLRELFGDELLVRTSEGMKRTERAVAMTIAVQDAVARVQEVLTPPRPFDPRTLRREFAISTADYGALVFLPALLARLREAAPNVVVRLRPPTLDPARDLERGELDLAILPKPPALPPRLVASRLWTDDFVCVVREGHPRVGRRLTLKRFVELEHAQIAIRGVPGGPVDDALAELGLSRTIRLYVAHFLVAPRVIAESDLLMVVSSRVARVLGPGLGLRALPVPFELAGFEIWQAWHPRHQTDPAHAWLRGVMSEVARDPE